jgi:hypothetical protein
MGFAYLVKKVARAIFAIQRKKGGLAQLARALAWHVRGHRFDPDILHALKAAERWLFSITRIVTPSLCTSLREITS